MPFVKKQTVHKFSLNLQYRWGLLALPGLRGDFFDPAIQQLSYCNCTVIEGASPGTVALAVAGIFAAAEAASAAAGADAARLLK